MRKTLLVGTVFLILSSSVFFVSFDGDERTVVNEVTGETSPFNADTDGDGLTDGQEVNTYNSNPTEADTDGNGIADGKEVHKYGTNPAKADTDGDGMSDVAEINRGTDPTSQPACNADGKNTDSDSDGLSNYAECRLGTDPNSEDTDGDGLTDHEEVEDVTDDGIDIPDSNPTHMDLYITVVETNNIDFDSYDSTVTIGRDSEKNRTKRFFANTSVENPNGQTGIDVHFKTVEEPDKRVVLADLSDGEYRRLMNRYLNKKYEDGVVHTIYVLSGKGDPEWGRATRQFAVGVPHWPTISHEVLHTVLGDIDGSECPRSGENAAHVCSESGLMNPHAGRDDRHLSEKTIAEIAENGFSTAE